MKKCFPNILSGIFSRWVVKYCEYFIFSGDGDEDKQKVNFLSLGNLRSHLNIRYILDGGINLICKGLQLNPLIY